MEEDAVHFYNNKVRLIIGFIFITALFSTKPFGFQEILSRPRCIWGM